MRVLALVDALDHVCCRYRIRAFEPALAASGALLSLEALARGPVARARQLHRAAAFDAVVLQRKLLPGWQLALLRRQARRLVFDFDDAVLYRDSYDPRGPRCPRRGRRFARTVQAADVVLAGNDFLADAALAAGAAAERVRVLPTCVDPTRYETNPERPDGDGLELVWIGSSSTLQGLEAVADLWRGLGRALPGLRLRVVCDRFPRFDPLPVVAVPWSEATEARALVGADAGVAVMPNDLWSLGKCGLKVLQYQAAGLPVVANPVGVHATMIRDGADGYLAATPDAWLAALRRLLDVETRRRLGVEARRSVEARYAVARWSPRFVEAVTARAAARGPSGRLPVTGETTSGREAIAG